MNITQKEYDALCDLQSSMAKAFRSKPTLRVLSGLMAKGLIEWDALGGTGKLTHEGELCLGFLRPPVKHFGTP